jgi:RNA-directed DNA polymerase
VKVFDEDVANNLYKLWDRRYMPPVARRMEIARAGCGMLPLGVTTIADRILDSIVESLFHEDSGGYLPGESARLTHQRRRKNT